MAENEGTEKKGFPLEKILTISAQEYAGPGVDIGANYEVRGVHYSDEKEIGMAGGEETWLESFARSVPSDAEAVVNYKFSVSAGRYRIFYQMSGTALIPKQKERKEE